MTQTADKERGFCTFQTIVCGAFNYLADPTRMCHRLVITGWSPHEDKAEL